MKAEKQRLTKLATGIEEKFPSGADIYGYPGITKPLIKSSIDETYKLLTLVENYKDHFEVIWFKREFARLVDDEFSLLKEVDSRDWANKFNKFLNNLFSLRSQAKHLYITLSKDPIRSDLEIAAIKDGYVDIKARFETIKDIIAKIESSEENLESFKTGSTAALVELKQALVAATQSQNKTNEFVTEIGEIHEAVTENQANIKVTEKYVNENLEMAKELSESNLKVDVQVRKNKKELDELMSKIQGQVELDAKLQDAIKNTLKDVNKFGLASAFQKRKNELRTSVLLWGTLTIIALSVLVYLSYEYAKGITAGTGASDPVLYLLKLPTIVATVWLGWFCSKQFGFTVRIREDYAYKTAVSMAFEGYKKETNEVSPELLEQLLKVTILNISLNPVAIFDTKNNHGSPMNEFGEAIRQFLKIDAKIKPPL